MTDSFPAGGGKPAFDIGRVFNLTFGTIFRNLRPFSLAAFLVVGLPYFILSLWPLISPMYDGNIFNDPSGTNELLVYFFAFSMAIALLAGFLVFFLQAMMIHASLCAFNHETVDLRESLRAGLKYFFPVLGLAILSGLGIGLGFLLFIVPGIILAMMWAVAIPSLITENLKISDALGRSSALTEGYKWWLLLFFIIMGVISSIVSAAGAIALAPFGGDLQTIIITEKQDIPISYWFVNAAVMAIVQMFAAMINAVGVAAIYFELRTLKEGIGPRGIAAVFD